MLLLAGLGRAQAQKEPPVVAPKTLADSMRGRDTTLVTRQQGKKPVQRAPNCSRAQPSPLCKMWLLMEMELDVPITTTRSRDPLMYGQSDFEVRAAVTGGAMVNVGKDAYGVALSTASEAGYDAMPFSLEARYRRWVSKTFTIDAGFGYRRRSVLNDFNPSSLFDYKPGNGVTLFAAITPEKYAGVLVREDVLRGAGRTVHAVSLGLRSNWLAEKLASWGGSVFGTRELRCEIVILREWEDA